jgi:hypothetical protein
MNTDRPWEGTGPYSTIVRGPLYLAKWKIRITVPVVNSIVLAVD